MGYFGKFEYYRPIPEIDQWIRRRIRMCYWKHWRWVRTKVRHPLALGVGKRQAILTGISSKSWWHLSKTKATQMAMSHMAESPGAHFRARSVKGMRDTVVCSLFPNRSV